MRDLTKRKFALGETQKQQPSKIQEITKTFSYSRVYEQAEFPGKSARSLEMTGCSNKG